MSSFPEPMHNYRTTTTLGYHLLTLAFSFQKLLYRALSAQIGFFHEFGDEMRVVRRHCRQSLWLCATLKKCTLALDQHKINLYLCTMVHATDVNKAVGCM